MIAALVPAAGLSVRMGRPKMLLLIEGQTLIGRVVTALREGGAERVVVVAPPACSAEGPAVALAATEAGAEVVAPTIRPAEMRSSIEIGLATLEVPSPPDRVLLAPGDAAGITRELVMRLLAESERHSDALIVPRCGGRGGHPVVLPWKIAQEVALLPPGQGASALLARHRTLVIEIPVADSRIADDIDTPEDLWRWRNGSGINEDDRGESGDALDARPQTWTRVRVSFFALARERAGCSAMDIELPAESRIRDLRSEIARRLPGLAPLMKNVMIAMNEEYADDEADVTAGARVAVIPPVSGGAAKG